MAEIANYSDVAIANLALQALGRGDLLTDLGEDIQAARVFRLRYPYARDAVLRAYDWNFAARRAMLPKNTIAPAFGYANAFDLPAECLLVRSVYQGESEKWVVEGRQILTDMGDPLPVKYTALVTDMRQADPIFVDALANRIAADIAITLTESQSKASGAWSVYQAKLREAQVRDAQEGQADEFPTGSWDAARIGNEFAPYRDWRGD